MHDHAFAFMDDDSSLYIQIYCLPFSVNDTFVHASVEVQVSTQDEAHEE